MSLSWNTGQCCQIEPRDSGWCFFSEFWSKTFKLCPEFVIGSVGKNPEEPTLPWCRGVSGKPGSGDDNVIFMVLPHWLAGNWSWLFHLGWRFIWFIYFKKCTVFKKNKIKKEELFFLTLKHVISKGFLLRKKTIGLLRVVTSQVFLLGQLQYVFFLKDRLVGWCAICFVCR